MAKWAVGLRMASAKDADVERAFQAGHILRTHLLRPTWHFVSPQDIRWLLKLTAPHVHRQNASIYRNQGLDEQTLCAARKAIEAALSGGIALSRNELAQVLSCVGIRAAGQRLAYLMMHMELEGAVVSAGRAGKQFTYALLEERCPATPVPSQDDMLGMLAERYFLSRGPATARDFAYWSGLSLGDARRGAAMLGAQFAREKEGASEWIFPQCPPATPAADRGTFLLPDYDEYGMGYKDRSALAPEREPDAFPPDTSHWLILRGRIEGTWGFSGKNRANARAVPYFPLPDDAVGEVENALARHAAFWKPADQGAPL